MFKVVVPAAPAVAPSRAFLSMVISSSGHVVPGDPRVRSQPVYFSCRPRAGRVPPVRDRARWREASGWYSSCVMGGHGRKSRCPLRRRGDSGGPKVSRETSTRACGGGAAAGAAGSGGCVGVRPARVAGGCRGGGGGRGGRAGYGRQGDGG